MQNLVSNFSIKDNFWDCNPNMKIVNGFKQLYDEDGSKKKTNSSRIVWAIALLLDKNKDNPYRNLSEVDKRVVIIEDFLEDKSFDFTTYSDLILTYENLCLDTIERMILQMERKLEERDIFINSLKYGMDNATSIDSLILNTKKLKDLYYDMKTELTKLDSVEGITRGGKKESAGEKGLV